MISDLKIGRYNKKSDKKYFFDTNNTDEISTSLLPMPPLEGDEEVKNYKD